MLEYFIIAIAFAIMLQFNYIREVLAIVRDSLILLDIENEETNYSPVTFAITFFAFSALLMPVMFLYIFSVDRNTVLKEISGAILKSYFQLEEK